MSINGGWLSRIVSNGGIGTGGATFQKGALKTSSEWFLKVTLDQTPFSKRLFDLGGLEQRYRRLVTDTIDDKRASDLISAVLRHGALKRGDVQIVLKTSERTARNTLSKLTAAVYLVSTTPKTSAWLAFRFDDREWPFQNFLGDGDRPTERQDDSIEHGSYPATIGGGNHGVSSGSNLSTAVDIACSGSG